MDYNTLKKKYNRCCQLVIDKQLSEAFTELQELASETHNNDYQVQLDNYRETYQNILKYSFGEIEDPEKKIVYFRLLRNIIEFADTLREALSTSNQTLYYTVAKHDPEYTEILNNQETQINRIFYHFWLTDKYLETETEFALQTLKSDSIPWWDKCVLISAITLSLQKYFNEAKFKLLAEAYKIGEDQVKQRALVGLIINLYQHNQRLQLYPQIEELINSLHQIPNFEKQVESIIIQFIKTKDTEKISQKFREEIFPEMAQIQSRIYDKLDMKNLILDPLQEDKNPDWENVFQDSPDLLNKLEEFSMLQMEGSDVFLSTFSMLKHFNFFTPVYNWFLPFHKENIDLQDAIKDDTGAFDSNSFAENMERSSILCNSDKYSFCLNIKYIPAKERTMMVEMFNMEIKAMDEIAVDDDLLNKPTRERYIFTQYIQDLYRFNKLFPNKQDFFDIFSTGAVFHNTFAFRWLIRDETIVRNTGEYLFEKGHYKDAVEVFALIDNHPKNFELWQKIAYSWQKMGDYQKALEYYQRADLMDIRKAWNIKKIALCYRRLGNLEKAIEYYLEAEKMEPENLQVQSNLAHTFFELKDYDNALKIYFKVEYLSPDNHKIQRPIAWCSLMLQKPETAKKYFEKIAETEVNKHDLLNLGHVEWCLGNKNEAILKYKQSVSKSGNNTAWFTEEFMADSEILIQYNIDPLDIPLMRDYVVSEK